MTTHKAVITAAREWIGTPYHHQGRLKGVGVDCIGLAIGVCHELGLSNFDTRDYARVPDGSAMQQSISEHCEEIDALEPAALLLMRIRRAPQHCGIYTENGNIIHAYASIERVTEHRLDYWWGERIIAIYRLPGVIA
jgi:NlpC/P60 family putative phage cell wall peptidase